VPGDGNVLRYRKPAQGSAAPPVGGDAAIRRGDDRRSRPVTNFRSDLRVGGPLGASNGHVEGSGTVAGPVGLTDDRADCLQSMGQRGRLNVILRRSARQKPGRWLLVLELLHVPMAQRNQALLERRVDKRVWVDTIF